MGIIFQEILKGDKSDEEELEYLKKKTSHKNIEVLGTRFAFFSSAM